MRRPWVLCLALLAAPLAEAAPGQPALGVGASLGGRRALSNVAAYEYDKLVPMLGIAYTAGIR